MKPRKTGYFYLMPLWQFATNMPTSDLIAIAAVLIALFSAEYARRSGNAAQKANEIARKANEIAVRNSLRPARLEVYRSMMDFAQYCSTYWTHWTLEHLGPVIGTRDLVERIDSFKWEIEQQGPLHMPDVETKASEFQRKAWQIQRLLDRLAVG